jgi:hypothetical protein
MTLTGILKNILLVIASVMIWNTSITFLQFFGYTIALLGLVYYSIGWDQIVTTSAGVWAYLKAFWSSPSFDESRLSPAVRRGLIMGLTLFIVALVTIGLVYGGDDGVTRVASR